MIYIVVESFNSWAAGFKVDGRSITPVIDSLCLADGVIYAPYMVSQVHSGVSSDGQLIYNTGLYPASDVTTVSAYAGNSYNSLAKRLGGHYSFEVIGESQTLWNHWQTTLDYGFDRLVSNVDRRARLEGRGRDEVIFEEALNVIDTLNRPFFAFITTISMHGPYKEEGVPMQPWIGDSGLTEQMKDYCNATAYFDSSLGGFLKGVGERFPENPPLIVIAADHKSMVDGAPAELADYRIPLLILNTPYTMTVEHPVGQVDVMPTVLSLLGREAEGCMGLSLFNGNLRGAVDSDGRIIGGPLREDFTDMLKIAQETSNIILRCDLAAE